MFKEPAIEKLIEYIQTLPEKEQRTIVKKISVKKKVKRTRTAKELRKNTEEFFEYAKKFRGRLPKDYKFDREEANER